MTHRDSLQTGAWRRLETPVGELWIGATAKGLARVVLPGLDSGAGLGETSISEAEAHVDRAIRELDEYFRGARMEFTVPLDRAGTGFRAQAQAALLDIGYGETATYGEIAARLGNPRAVRAVGSACATNPLPIIVPCHRVVRSDGSLGNYAGGTAMKRFLLDFERAVDRKHD